MSHHEHATEIQKILKSNNLYEILGVQEPVEPEILKAKYKKVILKVSDEIPSR